MSARQDILDKIRGALQVDAINPSRSYSMIERIYERSGKLDREACLRFFMDRLIDYDTEIIEILTEDEIPSAIAGALNHAHEAKALVPAAFPPAWLPIGPLFEFDENLTVDKIEGVPAVITTCEAAVASTGTIILVHEGAQGRRILTLLPDHHICLVRRDQVQEVLPQALASLSPNATKPITTISGPSATSDIEMTRIRGVHGPRRLTVILFG